MSHICVCRLEPNHLFPGIPIFRADAMEEALHSGSGAFLQDVIGSEGGTVPAR